MKPTATIYIFPTMKNITNSSQKMPPKDFEKALAPRLAPQTIVGQKWEHTKTLSVLKIREFVRLEIEDLIRARALPAGEYEIIANQARYRNTLKIAVRQMNIERLFDPVMLCLSVNILFQTPAVFMSTEALQYISRLENILNRYNRRVYSEDQRLLCAHFNSGVIVNSAFILNRICTETMV
jgi:hypothetical protein